MSFPLDFAINAHVLAPPDGKDSSPAIIDRLERALYDSDVEVINRGPDFLEFKVTIEDRLGRAFPIPGDKRLPPWSFAFIGGGTISLTEQSGVYRLRGDLRTSAIPLLRVLPIAIGAIVLPLHGILARLGAGIVVGLVVNAFTWLIAKWQFGVWMQETGSRISSDLTRAA